MGVTGVKYTNLDVLSTEEKKTKKDACRGFQINGK